MRVDLHQHLWTDPLLDALAERECLPFVRRVDGLPIVSSAGEQPYAIDPAAGDAAIRAAQLRADGIDRALIALSSPIGIEALPRPQAQRLIDAHLDGVLELGDAFGVWGPLGLDEPDADDVDRLIQLGCAGVSLPAGGLADLDGLRALGPVLERVAALGVPLLVHPGHGIGPRPPEPSLDDPFWWPALTAYVSQMQAAWLAFVTAGRRTHPALKIVFAMLAGGCPLLAERLVLRGGVDVDLRDPLTFYDTSGYGPGAVEAMARQVGSGQLVYGSDRPVVAEPLATERERELQENAGRLLTPAGAVA